ncbi:MAG: chaperone modulator CbpM [Pseudomonadales bacterium]|nr:chaperone modulator CbpM [Pseudomonadales bacterium]
MNGQQGQFTLQDICRLSGLNEEHLTEFVAHGIIQAAGEGPHSWVFDTHAICIAHRARRLQQDLDLEATALILILDLLTQREQLEQENLSLQQQLQQFLAEGF